MHGIGAVLDFLLTQGPDCRIRPFLSQKVKSWKHVCRQKNGSISICSSYPWLSFLYIPWQCWLSLSFVPKTRSIRQAFLIKKKPGRFKPGLFFPLLTQTQFLTRSSVFFISRKLKFYLPLLVKETLQIFFQKTPVFSHLHGRNPAILG